MALLSQIVVGLCFLALIVVLFFDHIDYLPYTLFLLFISVAVTITDKVDLNQLENGSATELSTFENIVLMIDWQVVFFLIAMFTIVEVLNYAKVFHVIAKIIVTKLSNRIRLMFYIICIVSTLSAAIIEDLSVAIIFIPIIVLTCHELKINPAPFLLGMTICINIASTLTPFGSAENIMIANEFGLSTGFFIKNMGIYFVITTGITLVLLDHFILKKVVNDQWRASCSDEHNIHDVEELAEFQINKPVFIKNLIGLAVFMCFLLLIHEIYVAGVLGVLVFVFLNAEKPKRNGKQKKDGLSHPQLSKYLRMVDYKLIYFFMCLFVLVGLMEANGTVELIDNFLESISDQHIFVMALIILLITSVLSGFLDNAPVTVMFLPIIRLLIEHGFDQTPLMIAFILGINLGGNFLPQGSAADMMTLELSQKYCVEDVNYKRLTKVGGLFALLHIILGIIYLAIFIFVYPGS